MIVGASFDTVEEQKAFAESENFPFALLADTDRAIGEAYEATRPADDGLAAYPLRISYLIAPDGTRQRSMSSLSNHDDIIHPARGLYGLVAVVLPACEPVLTANHLVRMSERERCGRGRRKIRQRGLHRFCRSGIT